MRRWLIPALTIAISASPAQAQDAPPAPAQSLADVQKLVLDDELMPALVLLEQVMAANPATTATGAQYWSFSGDLATAQACLEMGLFISFAGMLTYKTAENLRDVAKHVPLDRLLVETDCPYLAPVPMRGKRNEPAFVAHTAACLAEAKGVALKTIEEATSENARKLFSIE